MLSKDTEKLAAVDIGSNSIHLTIAKRQGDKLRRVASMSEKVQLAAGLDEHDYLSELIQQRGLDCLQRFAGRLADVNASCVRVVATNALRQAVNSQAFIERANEILPVPIEVVSGREEARLIYLGVAHTCPSPRQRLVVDIGGGSTELIVGQAQMPLLTESAQVGVVGFSQRFFGDGYIDSHRFERAIYAAQKEIITHANRYKKVGFAEVIGSSGAIKSIARAVADFGLGDTITLAAVEQLKASLLSCGHVDMIDIAGVRAYRKAIFPAGVAILLAVMKVFGIRKMHYCDGALSEGVMYDMLSRMDYDDVRDDSVRQLSERFGVDKKQAKRVAKIAESLFEQVREALRLTSSDKQLLRWASILHEVGLAIGHSSYQKHSSYLLKYADMAGFSRTTQEKLSLLVRYHRRAIRADDGERIIKTGGKGLLYLAVLLRMSVLVHHGRSDIAKQQLRLYIIDQEAKSWRIDVRIDRAEYQACVLDLQDDADWLAKWGIALGVMAN